MIFVNSIMMFSLISISSNNLMSLWYYMEMASFMFMFFLVKNKNPTESCVIYFIVSFMSTILIFLSIIQLNINSMEMNLFIMEESKKSNFLVFAFFLKMGVIPLHSWVFKMTKNMEWNSIMILFSIQKVIPIWAILMFGKTMISFLMIIMNSLITPLIPLKSNNSFFLISASSMVNNIWIILSTMCSMMTTIIFSISYFIMNSNLIFMMKKNNSKEFANSNSTQTMMAMLSIMGFPPFPNFFIKMMILKNILYVYSYMAIFSIIIIINNMISTIMYMKFIMTSVINFKNLLSMKSLKSNFQWTNNMMMMSPILMLMVFLYN